MLKEIKQMLGNGLCCIIRRGKRRIPVPIVGAHNRHDLIGVHFQGVATNAPISFGQGDDVTRRNPADIAIPDVMNAFQPWMLPFINFDDDLLGDIEKCLGVTNRRCWHNAAVFRNGGGFHHGNIKLAIVALYGPASNLPQMVIKIICLTRVDTVAHAGIRIEGGAEINAIHLGQRAIKLRAGGSAGNQADTIIFSLAVRCFHQLGQCFRHRLGVTSPGKTAGTNHIARTNQFCCGFCRADLAAQGGITNALCHERLSCSCSYCSEKRPNEERGHIYCMWACSYRPLYPAFFPPTPSRRRVMA
ncbi:hypothetical protein ATPR_1957 [Acetobacter tropicalis NBRC 101654]|uniref:Uncharacterized protein n=1 Tax=Acetobacter tropicalis NBRC 101654 TaxID=749388 RepID=F7VF08_9PROT|nr:hypothetical protein ATPR_1957 [Acetobacter tropicalis NBRC 101654]